ncbi:hypothetical protein BH23BAC2_BH23BAC2_25500 [soil metagenome]
MENYRNINLGILKNTTLSLLTSALFSQLKYNYRILSRLVF